VINLSLTHTTFYVTYLPGRTETARNLRNRTHNKSLINKTCHLNERLIIHVYRNSYLL